MAGVLRGLPWSLRSVCLRFCYQPGGLHLTRHWSHQQCASDSKVQLKDSVDEIDFIPHRMAMFDRIYARQQEEYQSKTSPITITLPNGSEKEGLAFQTTPLDIAKEISITLAKKSVISKVDGSLLWDMNRPLESSCKLELLTFQDSDEAKHVFWHSSSHVLGQCLERLYKGKLTVGPALDPSQELQNGGFYYDVDTSDLGEGQKISETHYGEVEKFINKIVKEQQPFERVVLTKEEALEMFKFNQYKQELISEKIADGATCTAYRCGPLIDLCRGPHIQSTSMIKAMKLVKNGATYWKNDNERESLQRVYGISFPDKGMMKDWSERRQRALENDHRRIGLEQKLFFFHDLSPGSGFWLPHGTRIYNKLQDFMRSEYRERGFTEVVTPNVFNIKLWETSGHSKHYRDCMFLFDVEDQEFGLKPMNCPGHCLMYKHDIRSHKDLPIRLADFGVLHRNELSGSLSGLTRVRRFCQDDAHIFCRSDQIGEELRKALDFMKFIYDTLGFTIRVELSTRPEKKYLGDLEVWNSAEDQLKQVLDEWVLSQPDQMEHGWTLNPGDGAFYGPKLDIKVMDSMKREHQTATIQLDFQLPERFDLTYAGADKQSHRPVMIHRAIYGSYERFIGILIEHLGGKWPFWLSPRQICVIPIGKFCNDYAREVSEIMHKAGFYSDVDDSNLTFKKKIRNAQVSQYNKILVVGKTEAEDRTVNVRSRDSEEQIARSLDDCIADFKTLEAEYK